MNQTQKVLSSPCSWKNKKVGYDFVKISTKYEQGNRNSQLVSAFERHKENNITARLYPNGFSSIEDVVDISKKIIVERTSC